MFECILISSFETLKTSKREVRRCLSVSLSVTLVPPIFIEAVLLKNSKAMYMNIRDQNRFWDLYFIL